MQNKFTISQSVANSPNHMVPKWNLSSSPPSRLCPSHWDPFRFPLSSNHRHPHSHLQHPPLRNLFYTSWHLGMTQDAPQGRDDPVLHRAREASPLRCPRVPSSWNLPSQCHDQNIFVPSIEWFSVFAYFLYDLDSMFCCLLKSYRTPRHCVSIYIFRNLIYFQINLSFKLFHCFEI